MNEQQRIEVVFMQPNIDGLVTYEAVGPPLTYEAVGPPLTYEAVGTPLTYVGTSLGWDLNNQKINFNFHCDFILISISI